MNNKEFLKEVGIRLKTERNNLNYTQAQLVEKLNKNLSNTDQDYLTDKQISRVECGESTTKLDKFVNWCLLLGKTPDYFLLGIDHDSSSKKEKIKTINEYLHICSEDDIDNILLISKAFSEKSNH